VDNIFKTAFDQHQGSFYFIMRVPIALFILFGLLACEPEKQTTVPIVYDGPLRTLEQVVILHSDSALIKARVNANRILLLQNEDREVPDGMFIEFLDETGALSATLKSDYAYYFSEEDRWLAQGNVIVDNIANEEKLLTEELYWEPKLGDVYTEKFVKIESPDQVITGTGLKAKQDFSTWTLEKPEGIFEIEDEEGAD
jgi:LPS export ABC transporter protein LptC